MMLPSQLIGAAWFPGSMRAIAPVIQALAARGWAAEVVASDSAWPVAERLGLTRSTLPASGQLDQDQMRRTLTVRPVALAITGVGECSAVELAWLAAVRRAGIPSLGVLDTWGDYERLGRASVPGGEYPDVLSVMNEQARSEAGAACAWPGIIAAGHPGLEEFVAEGGPDGSRDARSALGLTDAREVVAFCSQPIEQLFGTALGYTQFDALNLMVDALPVDTRVIVAVHPRDDAKRLRGAAGDHTLVLEDYNPGTLYAAADVVVSCFSACLIEAALALKPVVSLQPHLRGTDRCWASVLHIAESARLPEDVPGAIDRARALGRDRAELLRRRARAGIETGSIQRLIDIAEQLIGSRKRLSPA